MESVTTRCSHYDHPEFLLRSDDLTPQPDIEWLASSLEGCVSRGTRFRVGETVQFGWMFGRVTDAGDGRLAFEEPDMMSSPILWTPGVTTILRHLRIQKDAGDSLGVGDLLDFPSIRDGAIVGADIFAAEHHLLLSRVAPNGNDSGWFVGSPASGYDYQDPSNLTCKSLYQIAIWFPEIVMFMALPAGIRLELRPGRLSVWHRGRSLNPIAGSFLDHLLSRSSG